MIDYEFYKKLSRMLNANQARGILLSGNVQDLFFDGEKYVPLVSYLLNRTKPADGLIQIRYSPTQPITFCSEDAEKKLLDGALQLVAGKTLKQVKKDDYLNSENQAGYIIDDLKKNLIKSAEDETTAIKMLRTFAIVSKKILKENLLILVEDADILFPAGAISSLSDSQVERIGIISNLLRDTEFINGQDSIVLLSSDLNAVSEKITKLPTLGFIEAQSPNYEERLYYINKYNEKTKKADFWNTSEDLAAYTAGLSNYALQQLLRQATYSCETITPEHTIEKVQEYIKSQLGEDIVEFKKPQHTLEDVVGNTTLKNFIKKELIPRLETQDKSKALSGAAVAGSIGSGKTFIFEAMAAELGIPVLVLKNLRSQWYGQTDVIFERLKRILTSLSKVMIFIDEADTAFGSVSKETHSTERRLTGKIQAMMSDSKLKGKVFWLLMTARINLLSPDIRRPGRVGDLIIPVLDPVGDDRKEFVDWAVKDIDFGEIQEEEVKKIVSDKTKNYSAAAFASLRSYLKAHVDNELTMVHQLEELIDDLILPDIEATRKYQMLQAKLNCTRKSLFPEGVINIEKQRTKWKDEIKQMEAEGIF